MRKSTVAIAVLFVAVVWFGFQAGQPSAAEKPAPVVQKWEYQFLAINYEAGERSGGLNTLGDKGWEMCGMTQLDNNDNNSTTLMVFKRPKP